MPDIKHILGSIPIVVLVLCFSCEDESLSPGRGSDFYVFVRDDRGQPLEGVRISGGIDWDSFAVVTDSRGRALLPGYAYQQWATFRKNHYYTITVDDLRPGEYVLDPTPYILTEIGEVEGKAVIFQSHRIITVDHDGEYRVYSYDDNGVTEEALIAFPYAVRWFKLQRDTLWFLASDGDIYAYYIIDVFDPHLRLHLDVDRRLSIFDWKDSLLAVGSPYGTGTRAIEIFSFYPDSSVSELFRIEDFIANQIFFVSDYLVVLGFEHNFLSIFDVSDPSDIHLAAIKYQYEPTSSFLWGDTLGINYGYDRVYFRCRLFEFSDPLNPVMIANFPVDGEISEVINDTLAVGNYYSDDYYYNSLCVFKGSILEDFQAIAILSEEVYPGHQGSRPPYFILGGKLWKLQQR